MSSLADELLNDLDDLGGEESLGYIKEEDEEMPPPPPLKRKAEGDSDDEMEDDDEEQDGNTGSGGLVMPGGVKPADELDQEDVDQMELGLVEDVRSIAKLEGSKRMSDILQVCTIHFAHIGDAFLPGHCAKGYRQIYYHTLVFHYDVS